MSMLMISVAAASFFAPLLWLSRRSPRAQSHDSASLAFAPWRVPMLPFEQIVLATETAVSVASVLERLPADRLTRMHGDQALRALADFIQLLPGQQDATLGGLWRECLSRAAQALDWPACDKTACPRQPQALACQGRSMAFAALLAGALWPLREALASLHVNLLSERDAQRRPWVPMLGPMANNVWGARCYELETCADVSSAQLDLYRRMPGIAFEFVVQGDALIWLRQDAALHTELLGFLNAERHTRFDQMVEPPERHCTCFLRPGDHASLPALHGALNPIGAPTA